MKTEILLFSGGLDSYIAWHYLMQPDCLYVDLGHRYAEDEKATIANLGVPCEIVSAKLWGEWEQPDAYIPLRNLELVMQGALRANTVWLIVQDEERAIKDRDIFFFENSSKLLSHCLGHKVEVKTPFGEMSKAEMVRRYLKTGHSPLELIVSRSCYESGAQECGRCSACWRKFIALEYNGIDTTGHFENDPRVYGNLEYKPKLETYGWKRYNEMKKVMGW